MNGILSKFTSSGERIDLFNAWFDWGSGRDILLHGEVKLMFSDTMGELTSQTQLIIVLKRDNPSTTPVINELIVIGCGGIK